jgi:hypothetical protein
MESAHDKNQDRYHCMYPACGNDHRVPCMKLNLENLVTEISEPGMTLHLSTRPSFISSEISGGRANEVKYLVYVSSSSGIVIWYGLTFDP